jgi:hypothetical protein
MLEKAGRKAPPYAYVAGPTSRPALYGPASLDRGAIYEIFRRQ